MHHVEPAAHFLLHGMQGIAGNGLLDLRQQGRGVADKEIAHVLAAPERGLQNLDLTPDHWPGKLHDAAIEGYPAMHGREEAERAFAPNVRGLDSITILKNRKQ